MFTFLFSSGSFAIAKSLLTFMVANTLYVDEMRTFSVDIVAFLPVWVLVISCEFRLHVQQPQEILHECKIRF